MQGDLLLLLAAHLVLTALPGVAAMLVAARAGVRSEPILLGTFLAATGVVAMVAFWAYYADPVLGQSFSIFVLLGAPLLAIVAWRGAEIPAPLLRRLSIPLVLWVLGSAFAVFLGFVHGGGDHGIATAAYRYGSRLPSDNDLPHFFAEFFYANGHAGNPVYPPGWLASDRPPLQIGYVLSQRPLNFFSEAINYQVLGVILQSLWIVAAWALLVAAKVGRLTRALVMIAVLLSPIAILNSFFVWPKLLPGAMLLGVAALVLTAEWERVRRSPWGAALVTALLALGLLGHGSGFFGAIPLALVAAYRGMPSWRWLGIAAAVLLVLMVPWSAYQKYGQPPGDRLLKYSLAGVPEIDDRGFTETLVDEYSDVGLGGAIHNKGQNYITMVGGGPAWETFERAVDAAADGDLELAIQEVRNILFYGLLPQLALLLAVPVIMLFARKRGRERPVEWRFSLLLWAVFAFSAFIWGLLMFGDLSSRAVVHVGSYAVPIIGICAAVVGLRATFPRFAIYYVGLNALLMLAIYAPFFEPPEGTSYSALTILLAVLSLGGFAWFTLRGTGERTGEPAPGASPPAAAP